MVRTSVRDGDAERGDLLAQDPLQRAAVGRDDALEGVLRDAVEASSAPPPGVCRSRRAHIMGVRVSETTAEMRMVIPRVMANSRNSRPTTSPMNRSGMRTAMRETVRDMMVKPICFGALEGRLERRVALLDVPGDVLDHDDGVVHDEAGGDGEGHEGEVVEAEAQEIHERRRCRRGRGERRRSV